MVEILIGLEETGESVGGDRWAEHLFRAVGHAELAGGAVALEMGERFRAGRQDGLFVVLGERAATVRGAVLVGFFPTLAVALAFPVFLVGDGGGGQEHGGC